MTKDQLTLCILGDFALSSADFFSKLTFSKISFRNTIRVSNRLDPDQARRFVGPDLGPNCLQRRSADDTGRQRPIKENCLKIVTVDRMRGQRRTKGK